MLVREVMAIKGTALFTVTHDQPLPEAVASMSELDLGSLVVFENGQMVGLLTFREVIQSIGKAGAQWENLLVKDAMLATPITASSDMPLDQLRRLMVGRRQRYLPVMDGNTLMGVVSFHDVAKAVLEEQSFENRMLKNYIKNWPGDNEDPTSAE